ncbi:MAG: NAD(P)-dependent oxidoreductase [Rhodospirillales bacterium]|nr:NAD(P)-dependent oxidoreductase [Rhodospirillales bacterium]
MDSLNSLFTLRRQDFERPVLVTGSSGCIGSWALAILVRAGVPAVSFDLDTSRRRPGLLMSEEELARVTWVEGDIADAEAVDSAVAENGVGAILHLAALQVPFCRADPVLGARVNVVGTVAVFEAARRHGLRRIAYASSIAAHGAPAGSPYAPTLYGAYKACDEAVARTYWQDWQVPSIALRPGIVYGVGRDQGMTSKTTVAILAAAAGRDYEVPFTGRVSYLYAGEVAAAFLQAIARDGEGAPAFDINGTVVPVEDALAMLRRLAPGARVKAVGEPIPFPMEDRDALLRAHIGDYGAISLEDGTAETYRAFQVLLQDGRVSPDV